MELLDSCDGLLLLRCCTSTPESPPSPPCYVVCNPTTGEWVALPQPSHAPAPVMLDTGTVHTCSAALGFDPAVSSNFYVFQLVQLYYCKYYAVAVEIYSSETGRWVLRESGWSEEDCFTGQMTYFKGYLHFCIVTKVIASVDTEGQAWRISRPEPDAIGDYRIAIGHSQGRLLCVCDTLCQNDAMSIYVLEDHDSEEWVWTFKQSISKYDLFGPTTTLGGEWDYYVAAFHPDSDFIFFFDWSRERLISYDMEHRDVHDICTLGGVPNLVHGETIDVRRPFLPYVPLYSKALTSPSVN